MEELGLNEENLQDVVVEEDELPAEATRWMAMARVYTNKTYSHYWFYRNMRVAWDLAQEVKLRPLEENLYTLHPRFPPPSSIQKRSVRSTTFATLKKWSTSSSAPLW